MKTFIASTLFMIVFCMMFTPLAILALGIEPQIKHVGIGVVGLVLFFVLPAVGAYGEEL